MMLLPDKGFLVMQKKMKVRKRRKREEGGKGLGFPLIENQPIKEKFKTPHTTNDLQSPVLIHFGLIVQTYRHYY
jgi:hypothetical protein